MKRKRSQRKWLLIILAFGLMSCIFYSKYTGLRYPPAIEGSLSFVLETPERWLTQSKEYFSEFFGGFDQQKNNRDALERQTKKASEYMSYAHILEARIKDLENKLTLTKTPHIKRFSHKIFAEVSHQHDNLPLDLYRGFTSQKKATDQLHKDAVIMNHAGLVGSIMRHGNNGFDFKAVNHPRFRADIFLERTHQRGLWKGTGKATSELTLQSYSDIKIGDLILTSGLKDKFPAHIPIGFIKHLEYSSNGLTNKILVEPLVNFANLRYVYVLLNENSTLKNQNSLHHKNISLND